MVTKFEPNLDQKLPGAMTREQLEHYLDKLIPNKDVFCVFYIRGNFQSVLTRSQQVSSDESNPQTLKKRSANFHFTDF